MEVREVLDEVVPVQWDPMEWERWVEEEWDREDGGQGGLCQVDLVGTNPWVGCH